MNHLFAELPEPKRFAVLRRASHFHWFEDAERLYDECRPMWERGNLGGADIEALGKHFIPFSELCPAAHGIETLRALSLAHMDANLKGMSEATAFLESDLDRQFEERGIDLRSGERAVVAGA